jgi:hypothetical protein
MHPLCPDLTKLNDDQLQEKIVDLQKRFIQASRCGPAAAMSQINMMLEDYQFELQRRQEKMMEDMMKNNKKFTDIIDIS